MFQQSTSTKDGCGGVGGTLDGLSTMARNKRDNLSPWIYFDQITFDYGILLKKNVILEVTRAKKEGGGSLP